MSSARKKEPAMRRPPARSILCGVALVVVTAAAPGAMAFAASADLPGGVLEVAVKSGRLSLRAYQARLADVLEAIGRQAGVRIVLHGNLHTPVTDMFANVPLDEGVRRLSRLHSVVLIYSPFPGRPNGPVLTEVWVTGSSSGPVETAQAARGAPRSDAPRADTRPLVDRSGWTPQLTSAVREPNPEIRSEKMEALVRERGAYAVVHALREAATRDPAPGVRRAAIRVLASMTSPDADEAVRATLGDPHAGVRWEAQKALAQQSRARASEDSMQ